MKNLKITLEFPSSIYYADKYAAVRSVIGNDVEINSISEQPLILPDNVVLVNVEYSALDFNSFIIYKVVETKILNNMSSKNVVTKIYDPISKSEISEIIMSLGRNKINVSDYITIRYSSNANYKNKKESDPNSKIIKYYFLPVSKNSILKSYCSIVDTSFLSYHGSEIQHTPKFNETIKEIKVSNSSNNNNDINNIIQYINEYLDSHNSSLNKNYITLNLQSNNFSKPKNLNLLISDNSTLQRINLKDFKPDELKNEIYEIEL